MGGESVSSPIEFGANDADSSRSGKRICGIDGLNLDAERDMVDLLLEPNVSLKDKLMKSTRRLDSVAIPDFNFDPDLVDRDASFSREVKGPIVTFSEKAVTKLGKDWHDALVIKLLG
ncbi:hypothetical protein TB1_032491 [Malus domestica]